MVNKSDKKEKDQKEHSNVELDTNEANDIYQSVGFEKYELTNNDKEEKYLLAEETPNMAADEDLTIPKWASYDSPLTQQAQIKKELADVKKSTQHWNQL